MSIANTAQTYGMVTKNFHWLTALLILTLIPLGIVANDLPYDTSEELARKAILFSIHKTLGVTMFFVALARIVWALTQPKPAPMHPDRRLEHWAAETVHWLLYGSLVLVPLSGWIHHASTSGFAPIWWPLGQNLPLVPKSEGLASVTAGLHIVFGQVLIVALILHIAGALKHHVVDRDKTLRRMWFGRVSVPRLQLRDRRSLPVISALAAWCIAVGMGGALGLYTSHAAVVPTAPELTEVASDWQVTDGDIAIEVSQLGDPVQGSFSDWTADITFDPEVSDGKAGEVVVAISIPSLTLGSVTQQALGPDFFAAEAHPTARYTADILTAEDGYVADGALTLKDSEVPVRFPFSLELNGDTASMQASVTLDRMKFGIGTGTTDESTLGFMVDVRVAVTATRGDVDE